MHPARVEPGAPAEPPARGLPRMARAALVLDLALVLALAGVPRAARAQSFAPPANISQSASGSYLPSLTRDRGGPAAGTLRLFWHDFTSSPNLAWCSESISGSFPPGAACAFNVTQSWTPRAASDAFGVTHVVWRDRTGGVDDIYHARFDGLAWSAPENLSRSAAASRNPVLAIDPWDRPHVVFEEDTPGGVRYFESHFDGSAWSLPADTGLAYSTADTLRLACDGAGVLHAVWPIGATPTEVAHAERPDGGAWSAAENLSLSPGSYSVEPAIAVDAGDGLHVAWVEQDAAAGTFSEICMSSRSAGGAWSPRQDITSLRGDAYHPAIAVGSDDVARVAFGWGPLGDREVLFLASPGATPVNVSVSAGVDSDRASLLLDDTDAPWIAWQEGSAPTPEVYLAAAASAPPPAILLMVAKAGADVLLSWTGGAAPFTVSRAAAPGAPLPWPALTPGAGIAARAWTDAGAAADGVTLWCYLAD